MLAVVLVSTPGLNAAPATGVSILAGERVIERGIDVFTTLPNGKTYYDFAANPIPAGFFCDGSPAFSGRVALTGLPLVSEIPGQLRGADTVIERLDNAAFGADGTAVTRVQVRALSLVSIEPLKTPCGAFHAYVALDGEQRQTTMHIHRTHEGGGSFVAPLDIKARMSFVPADAMPLRQRRAGKLELVADFTFPGYAIPWSLQGGPGSKSLGPVVVDTDGDLAPDTYLTGTSNFAAGWQPEGVAEKSCCCTLCEPEICHSQSGHLHCTGPVYACGNYQCP